MILSIKYMKCSILIIVLLFFVFCSDLLSSELGEMVNSLQINYMVDIGWLLAQYFYSGNR